MLYVGEVKGTDPGCYKVVNLALILLKLPVLHLIVR
jgi:hypothetical protein